MYTYYIVYIHTIFKKTFSFFLSAGEIPVRINCMVMNKDDIEKELLNELKLGRGFYTELEHLIMSLMHTNEKIIQIIKIARP